LRLAPGDKRLLDVRTSYDVEIRALTARRERLQPMFRKRGSQRRSSVVISR